MPKSNYITKAELAYLKTLAKTVHTGIIEIGVLYGETLAELASVANCPVYGIDPIIPDSMNPNLVGSSERITENIKPYPHCLFFHEYSYKIVKEWKAPFDLIILDGDHTEFAVRRDVRDWLPKLKIEGYMLVHDSSPCEEFYGWPGPIAVANELINNPIVEHFDVIDTFNVFRKVAHA